MKTNKKRKKEIKNYGKENEKERENRKTVTPLSEKRKRKMCDLW